MPGKKQSEAAVLNAAADDKPDQMAAHDPMRHVHIVIHKNLAGTITGWNIQRRHRPETSSPIKRKTASLKEKLFALAAFYDQYLEEINVVRVYLNSEIDLILFIETPTRYKKIVQVCLSSKTIYSSKQSAQYCSKYLTINMTQKTL